VPDHPHGEGVRRDFGRLHPGRTGGSFEYAHVLSQMSGIGWGRDKRVVISILCGRIRSWATSACEQAVTPRLRGLESDWNGVCPFTPTSTNC
jgi:hypothetical protein